MTHSAKVQWTPVQPGWSWRSTDGRYVILRSVLPETRANPSDVFHLRKIDPEMAAAYPGKLGYLLGESWSFDQADAEAQRDAWASANGRESHVPEDYQALALQRFFWPISQGTSRAALAVERDGDRVVAKVVGMSRSDGDDYEPGTYAELDLTGILTAAS